MFINICTLFLVVAGELRCVSSSDSSGCLTGEFACGDRGCVPLAWRCDFWRDCRDASDEANCPCREDETRCPSEFGGGRCLPISWLCDGWLDCDGSWDELGCTGSEGKVGTATDEPAHRTNDGSDSVVTTSSTPSDDVLGTGAHFGAGTVLPEECSWAAWSDWSACPGLCTARRQTRNRECLCPDGDDFEDYDGCGTADPDEVRTCPLVGCLLEADTGCGTRSPQEPVQRIVNGDTAAVGAWPWQAQLWYRGSFICGGTLVGRRHVLTAAHCFDAFSGAELKSRWTVLLGKHTLTSTVFEGQHSSGVDQLIVHEAHDDDANTNDIAIIVLADPLPEGEMGDLINHACLDLNRSKTFDATSNCFISGWGYLSYRGVVSYELQEANIPLIDHEVCNSSLVYGDKIRDGMQCAGYLEGGIDSCTGDSGGPLVCAATDMTGALSRWYLVGIISWGKRCAKEYRPGVYTNVSSYKDWIVNQTAGELH